jgi:hypothetical protein
MGGMRLGLADIVHLMPNDEEKLASEACTQLRTRDQCSCCQCSPLELISTVQAWHDPHERGEFAVSLFRRIHPRVPVRFLSRDMRRGACYATMRSELRTAGLVGSLPSRRGVREQGSCGVHGVDDASRTRKVYQSHEPRSHQGWRTTKVNWALRDIHPGTG